MRIVFHAGFHKTGTSSLQRALMEHAPALAGVQVALRQTSAAFRAAAEAARAVSVGGAVDSLRARLAEWVAGLSGADLIASSEDFAGHMPGRFGLVDYRAAGVVLPEVVRALRARFAGGSVDLVFTTRAARPWLASLHWQLAKHPEMTLKQRRFCRDFAAAAAFDAVLDPLEVALTGQAVLHRVALEDLAGRRLGPVEAVYDVLGLPDAARAALPVVAKANVAPPVGLADQFVTLNRAGLSAEDLHRAKTDLALLMTAYPLDRA